jgi:hypothetical protein
VFNVRATICYALVVVGALMAGVSYAQVDTHPLTKAGGMVYFWADNYSLSLEREKAFAKAPAFTHGLRLDYDGINHNLVPGYQFKVYPFHNISKIPYRGFFAGAAPCFFVKLNYEGSIGPGLGTLLGYQWRIGSKSTLSVETDWVYMNNLEESVAPVGWNFYFLGFVKFGYQFGKK